MFDGIDFTNETAIDVLPVMQSLQMLAGKRKNAYWKTSTRLDEYSRNHGALSP
jgi:hypothetical protein